MNTVTGFRRCSTLNRAGVLAECAKAAMACWNHYSDNPFPEGKQFHQSLARDLSCWFPAEFASVQTKRYRRG